MREDDRTNTIIPQHATPFGEGLCHNLLEESAIFWTTVPLLGFILHSLVHFRGQWIMRLERVAQQRILWQNSLEPHVEKV
jgi:hypothetical protein